MADPWAKAKLDESIDHPFIRESVTVLPPPHSCAVEWESDVAYGWTITVLRHPPEPDLKFCPSCGEDLTKPPVTTFDV